MIKLYFDSFNGMYTIVQDLEDEYGEITTLVSDDYSSLEKIAEEIFKRHFTLPVVRRLFNHRDTYDKISGDKIKEYNHSNLKVFIEQEFPEYMV